MSRSFKKRLAKLESVLLGTGGQREAEELILRRLMPHAVNPVVAGVIEHIRAGDFLIGNYRGWSNEELQYFQNFVGKLTEVVDL